MCNFAKPVVMLIVTFMYGCRTPLICPTMYVSTGTATWGGHSLCRCRDICNGVDIVDLFWLVLSVHKLHVCEQQSEQENSSKGWVDRMIMRKAVSQVCGVGEGLVWFRGRSGAGL